MLELSAKDFKIDIITVVKKVRTTTLGNIQVPQKEIETKPNGKLQHLKFFFKKVIKWAQSLHGDDREDAPHERTWQKRLGKGAKGSLRSLGGRTRKPTLVPLMSRKRKRLDAAKHMPRNNGQKLLKYGESDGSIGSEAQQTPNRTNANKVMPRHAIVKVMKTKNERKGCARQFPKHP